MILASGVLVGSGIVLLLLGLFRSSDNNLILASIAATALAGLFLILGTLRDRKRAAPAAAVIGTGAPAIESIPGEPVVLEEAPTQAAPIELEPAPTSFVLDEPEAATEELAGMSLEEGAEAEEVAAPPRRARARKPAARKPAARKPAARTTAARSARAPARDGKALKAAPVKPTKRPASKASVKPAAKAKPSARPAPAKKAAPKAGKAGASSPAKAARGKRS